MPTLQELADKEGVTRQAIWLRTAKGKAYCQRPEVKAYQKAYLESYRQRPEYKAYQKTYQKTYRNVYKQRPYVKAKAKAYHKARYHRLHPDAKYYKPRS